MGQSIAKRALISKQASIYDTSVWARRYRHDFEALQLSEEQVRLMWDEYCKIDEDKSGEISLWELFEALDMKQSKFTKRIFRIFDEDGSGSVDFREFVMSLWNYCTLSKAALIMFAFDLYDNDNSGEIDIGEVELLLKEVYGREFQSNTHAQTIMAKLRGSELGLARNINVDQFREFCRTHPAVLYPAFVLQTQMQEKILGSKFWISCSNARVALSSGAYVDIAAILHAHVNEKAFAALVDSKDAVTGKQVTPLADSDNVAMLQMSGTLANSRRLLRTTIKSHMGNIQAIAKEENGANNAGGRHSQVMQGAKVDHTPPAASPPAGEGRKGVSWGTVKTHKIYVVDSGGDDNGSEVVDPGIMTQVPPEAPQEVTGSPTQRAATTSPARAPHPTDSAAVPTRLRQESKLAPHANSGQHRISGGSQKASTTRPKPSAGTVSRNSLVTRTQVKAMSARRQPGQPARGSSDGTHR
ncbi:unnamed protein product [Ectocarpus sp. 12 AP-2014]